MEFVLNGLTTGNLINQLPTNNTTSNVVSSFVCGDNYGFFTDSNGGTQTVRKIDDAWFECEVKEVPLPLVKKVNMSLLAGLRRYGNVDNYPPRVDVPITDEYKTDFTPKKVSARDTAINHRSKTLHTAAGRETNYMPERQNTFAPKTSPVSAQAAPKLSIADLLTQCSETIEELAEDLGKAQTECYPLTHYFGKGNRYKRAKKQLSDAGFIEVNGRETVLTPLGLEQRIGTHVRSKETTQQLVRFTDKVLGFVDLDKPKEYVPRVPLKVFTNPNGERVEVTNLTDFCIKHDLRRQKMYMVLNGTAQSHKGWTKTND